MRVNSADGLEVGVDGGAANEGHTARFEVGGDLVGERALGFVVFVESLAAGKSVEIVLKGAEFLADLTINLAVFNAGDDLAAIANDF